MEENEKTLAETISGFLGIVRRNKFYLLIPFITISLASSVIAVKLPMVYRSMGTILIEQQQIPQSMIQTTVTGFADERIRFIQQRVMTRESILSIIEKYHLYAKKKLESTPSELVEQFQKDATVDMIAADVKSAHGGGGKATIAFTIDFKSERPEMAQQVANELVNLFLAENSRVRTQRATKTTEFINDEAERVNRDIQGIENKIAAFKEKFGRSLPELLPSNLTAAERINGDIRQTENQINLLKERIAFLTSSLPRARQETAAPQQPAGVKAPPGFSKEEQIRSLKAEYMQLSSQYNPTHPDVLRVERQIKAFDPSFAGALDQGDVSLELEKTRQELDALVEKYGESYPDVVKLKQKVKKLEQHEKPEYQSTQPPPASRPIPDVSTGSSDPVYINLLGQFNSSQSELDGLVKRLDDLKKNLQETNGFIAQTPQVERGYNELVRERETSLLKYSDLKSKAQEARLAQTLEEEQKGESFTLIDPPTLPDKPEKGTRKKVFFAGLGASLLIGLGMTVLADALDGSIRGHRALQTIAGIQPILVIPYIKNDDDLAQERRKTKFFWTGCIIILLIAVLAVHFFLMPLDELWERLMFSLERI